MKTINDKLKISTIFFRSFFNSSNFSPYIVNYLRITEHFAVTSTTLLNYIFFLKA